MRRTLLYLLLFVVLAAACYLLLRSLDGSYVLVYVGGFSIETTVTALVMAIAALVLLFNGLLWLLRTLNPWRMRRTRWFQRVFGNKDPLQASVLGLQDLLLGNWQAAYRALVENAEQVQNPCSNYMAAALAAFQRNDRAGWTFCLDSAEKHAPGAANGVRSLRALLEARSGGRQQAMSMLQSLQRVTPNQPFVLQQLLEHYRALGNREGLAQLLPELEKRGSLPPQELLELQEIVHGYRLQQAGLRSGQGLQQAWKQIPKLPRSSAKLTGIYLQQLVLTGQDAEAASTLTAFLKKQWSDEVVILVGQLGASKTRQQLVLLELCYQQQPEAPVLLLTLGQVLMRNQLWGRARELFDKALQLTHNNALLAQLNSELARLLEQTGEREKSLLHYQRAMKLLESQ